MSDAGEWLTAPKAAAILGITTKELRQLIFDGVIAGYRYQRGGRVRLKAADVEALAELDSGHERSVAMGTRWHSREQPKESGGNGSQRPTGR